MKESADTNLTDEDLYGDCLPKATDAELSTIADLVARSVELDNQIEVQLEQIKALTEKKRTIDEKELPDAMYKAGTGEWGSPDGTVKVSVENKVYGSLSEERKPKAFEWLRSNNQAGLIINQFVIPLKKGMDVVADVIADFLKTKEVEFEKKENVNTATFQAFVREQVKAGNAIPLDLFGVHMRNIAIIKIKKPKKV